MFALFLILAIMAILGQAFLISKQREGFISDDEPSALFGGGSKTLYGLRHINKSNIENKPEILQYDVSLSKIGRQYFDIWQMSSLDAIPNTQKIKSYLNNVDGGLMHDSNVEDISGFLIGCAKAVYDADLTYGEISDTGCRGGDILADGPSVLLDTETITKANDESVEKGKLLTFDAKKLIDIIEKPTEFTSGSNMTTAESCSIVYDNAIDGWVCASNCLIGGNVERDGNAADGNLGDKKMLYHLPLYGMIKHGDSYEFQCDTINSMYALPSGASAEPRKCEFGKLNKVSENEQLDCGVAREVPKCQVLTNVDDVRCLTRTYSDPVTGKRYRYCPIICQNEDGETGNGACQTNQDCAGHLHKHDPSDTTKRTPHKHPVAGINDGVGYTRIEVDEDNNPSNINLERNNSQIYGDLMQPQTTDPDSEQDINVSALEKTTIGGLFDHVLNKMPVKNLKNFMTGIQSYFATSPLELKEQTKWMNDHSGYGLDGSIVDGSLKNAPFTSAGGHLKISQLADPSNFKNNNQYISRGREILYERKRSIGRNNLSLNPEGVPKKSLAKLGKVDFNIGKLTHELNNEYISTERKRVLRKKLVVEKDKKVNLINRIELAEDKYDNILNIDKIDNDGKPVQASYYDMSDGVQKFLYKQDGTPAMETTDGKRGGMLGFKQNDDTYIPFKIKMPKYYRTADGQYLETPAPST
tara:strand:+ start:6120 stop:8213 length:2094 start_codon:yes stop_codon:yes gene_type:complete